MRMFKGNLEEHKEQNRQRGSVLLEACIVFPVMFVIIMIIIYVGNLYFQKAQIDDCVERAAIKGAACVVNPQLYDIWDQPDKMPDGECEPYRYLFGKLTADASLSKLEANIGDELIKDINENVISFFINMHPDLESRVGGKVAEYKNYLIYGVFKTNIKYTIKVPIDWLISGHNKLSFSSHAEVAVTDVPEFVRNIDMIMDMFAGTELGKTIGSAFEKVNTFVEKFAGKTDGGGGGSGGAGGGGSGGETPSSGDPKPDSSNPPSTSSPGTTQTPKPQPSGSGSPGVPQPPVIFPPVIFPPVGPQGPGILPPGFYPTEEPQPTGSGSPVVIPSTSSNPTVSPTPTVKPSNGPTATVKPSNMPSEKPVVTPSESTKPSGLPEDKNGNFTNGSEVVPKYSTLEQRYAVIPSENGNTGYWTGKRGESMYVSDDPRVKSILEEHNQKGINYKNGMPDFSPFAIHEFTIDMTNDRSKNFAQANKQLAKKLSEETGEKWTSKRVSDWMSENHYTWHELNDCKTIQMIPSAINHPIFKHLGGVGEINISLGGN